MPLIPYKNENIYGLLLTPVKKLYSFAQDNIEIIVKICNYCVTCKLIELIAKL